MDAASSQQLLGEYDATFRPVRRLLCSEALVSREKLSLGRGETVLTVDDEIPILTALQRVFDK